jgi:hypothetical protein
MINADPTCLIFDTHTAELAERRSLIVAITDTVARTAMMAMTTRISVIVKPAADRSVLFAAQRDLERVRFMVGLAFYLGVPYGLLGWFGVSTPSAVDLRKLNMASNK